MHLALRVTRKIFLVLRERKTPRSWLNLRPSKLPRVYIRGNRFAVLGSSLNITEGLVSKEVTEIWPVFRRLMAGVWLTEIKAKSS